MKELLMKICMDHSVDPNDVMKANRIKCLSDARQEFMHKAFTAGNSIGAIGRFLNKDYQTVRHGITAYKYKQVDGARIKQENMTVIEMAKQGKSVVEIKNLTGFTKGKIYSTIYRQKKNHGLQITSIKQHEPKDNAASMRSKLNRQGMKLGTLSDMLSKEMSVEVRDFWIDKAFTGKYETISECVADFLVDYYFEQKGQKE